MVSIAVVSKNLVKVATRRFVFSLFGVGEVLIGDLARVLSFAELSLHDLTFTLGKTAKLVRPLYPRSLFADN